MSYIFWIPTLISIIILMSWLSCKSDESWRCFFLLFVSGAVFQLWPWVAKFTNRIVFDAILYDSIAVIAWTGALIFFSGTKFTIIQWIGTSIVMFGLFLIQKG